MKQLLYWCQTSYKLQVQCFSSAIIFTIQPNYSSTNKASRASEHYVQIEVSSSRVFPSSATNPFLIFCRSIYRKMRRWDFNKISQRQLMQSEDFSALWEASIGEITGGSAALTFTFMILNSKWVSFDFEALCMFCNNSADIYLLVSLQK